MKYSQHMHTLLHKLLLKLLKELEIQELFRRKGLFTDNRLQSLCVFTGSIIGVLKANVLDECDEK